MGEGEQVWRGAIKRREHGVREGREEVCGQLVGNFGCTFREMLGFLWVCTEIKRMMISCSVSVITP